MSLTRELIQDGIAEPKNRQAMAFDFGDRFSMEDGAEVGELKELNVKTTA